MGRKIDLTGQRFGKWTVLSECKDRSNGAIKWLCRCDCGSEKEVNGQNLRKGVSNSCGCIQRADLIGVKFGRLTVMEKKGRSRDGLQYMWKCICECGKYKDVTTGGLTSGDTRSCGCIARLDLTGMKFGKLKIISSTLTNDKGKTMCECVCDCGKYVVIQASSIKHGTSKSCGCTGRFKSGEHHPLYNPNIPFEYRLRNRQGIGYKNSRKYSLRVRKRDDFTCGACSRKGAKLHVHHLNSWNAFPEQRFDTANGITLCEDCHKEFHRFNGYGNNTLEQFRDHLACLVGEEHVSEIEETLLSRESEIISQEQPTRGLQTT